MGILKNLASYNTEIPKTKLRYEASYEIILNEKWYKSL
jgi:hypothetical protein